MKKTIAYTEPLQDRYGFNRKFIATLVVGGIVLTAAGTAVLQASAFGDSFLSQLDETQRQVLLEARTLKESGKYEAARDLIAESKIDLDALEQAHHATILKQHVEISKALETDDYEAFKVATRNAPFKDQVNTELFKNMKSVHILKMAGDFEGATEISQAIKSTK